MRMPIALIRSYLSILTTVVPAPGEHPMDRMEGFDRSIATLQAKLRRGQESDDAKWLRLAMKSLIKSPESRILKFRGQCFLFSEAELVRLFSYAYQKLWSSDCEYDDVATIDVSFESMTDQEWAEVREVTELLYGY